MGIKNIANKNGFLIRTLCNFFEHRALWLYQWTGFASGPWKGIGALPMPLAAN
jgi:hypothetical protein